MLDELFTGVKNKATFDNKKSAGTSKGIKDLNRSSIKTEIKSTLKPRIKREKDEITAGEISSTDSTVIDNISKACNGNKYLESIILGELLNSPKFKK